ncbi:DUF3623 domain-containing protein [Sphingosinicellaceae bacterium]|nr:DUF3623 domain-containing protein [Sphingosinicellaceae bacterium]
MSWVDHGWPLVYAGGLWFVATGAVLALDSRKSASYARSLVLTGVLACVSLVAIAYTADDGSPLAAYVGFTASLLIWGWHELAFLTGAAAGPRRDPLPEGATGWTRFRLSAATLIHHELALALTAALLTGLCWRAANPVAAQAFGLLFAMRLSTKLNIFVGVPHFDTTMLPPHLSYLSTYFRSRRVGLPMVLSLMTLIGLAVALGSRAASLTGGAAVGASLVFALVALGLLEHLFLVMPTRDAALWRWAKPGKVTNNAYRTTGAAE